MSKQIFEIKLDFFGGFYDSIYENCDTGYCEIKEEVYYQNQNNQGLNLTEDDYDFDYETRHQDVIDAFINTWKNYAPDVVKFVAFDHLWSPKYYNFATDEIYVNVKLAPNWKSIFRTFMKENYEWLKEHIKEDWTSYDGFTSFMENDIENWDSYLFSDMDERYISSFITYMMLIQYESHKNNNSSSLRDDIAFETMEDIYDGNYLFLNESGQEKMKAYEELVRAREEDAKYPCLF